jgi:hypothetical protein
MVDCNALSIDPLTSSLFFNIIINELLKTVIKSFEQNS